MQRRNWIRSMVGAAALLGAFAAPAQEGAPLRVILPFPPGGGTDALARLLAPKLSRELGRPLVVENKPGASGQIAVSYVKGAAPDGGTVLFTSDHSLVAVPQLNPKAGYDPVRDFTALGQVSRFALGLAVSNGSGAKSLADFAAYVKANPAQATYGLPVVGGFPSTVGVAVAKKIGVPMQAVPFTGSAPLIQNIMGEQVPAGVTAMPDFLPMANAGKLRLVAVTGSRRSSIVPDVPTFEELGYTGLAANSWYAFFGPKDVPRAFAERFNKALAAVLADAEVKKRIAEMAHDLAPTTLEEAAAEMEAGANFWKEAAKSPDFVRP